MEIERLKISELRSVLKDMGLSGSGTKKELIERYNEHMEEMRRASDDMVLTVNVSTAETAETAETSQTDHVEPIQEINDVPSDVNEST